jgi:uncharacterized OsmC-like protein
VPNDILHRPCWTPRRGRPGVIVEIPEQDCQPIPLRTQRLKGEAGLRLAGDLGRDDDSGTLCQSAESAPIVEGMDRDELRALQKPLKEQYKETPASAVVTLRAEGDLGDSISCSVSTGRALVEAGLHPATGGDGTLACSGDMLLQALVACAGVTLRSVAVNRGLEVRGVIRAEGDLDFRGTLGVDAEAPVGFRAIRLLFDLTSDAPQADLDALIATTERYCVVLQTLVSSPDLSVVRA